MTDQLLIRRIDRVGSSRFRRLWITRTDDHALAEIPESVRQRLLDCYKGTASILVIEDGVGAERSTFVIERISKRRSLVVFGAGHVGQSVAAIGAILGLEVSLVDDRPEFLSPERMAAAGIMPVVSSLYDIENALQFDKRAAVVIVTRGHQFDEVILRQVAAHEVGYVGMIGSKRRVRAVFQELRKDG